ncbi:MAG TPA: hypothetical protein VF308_06725 [Caldimonas sp.]
MFDLRVGHGTQAALRDDARGLEIGAGQQQGEFLAAIARDEFALALDGLADEARHRAQPFVAGGVAVAVVVVLEMVDVDHQQRHGLALARGARPLGVQRLVEEAPVADLCQPVDGRELRQALVEALQFELDALAFGDVHVRAHHAQRPAVGCALDDLAAAQQPGPVAGLLADPEFRLVGHALLLEMGLQRHCDALGVLRVKQGPPSRTLVADLSTVVAELEAGQLVLVEPVAGDVPIPEAELGATQREFEPLGGALPFLFGRSSEPVELAPLPLAAVETERAREQQHREKPAEFGRVSAP